MSGYRASDPAEANAAGIGAGAYFGADLMYFYAAGIGEAFSRTANTADMDTARIGPSTQLRFHRGVNIETHGNATQQIAAMQIPDTHAIPDLLDRRISLQLPDMRLGIIEIQKTVLGLENGMYPHASG